MSSSPPAKRAKTNDAEPSTAAEQPASIIVQFESMDDEALGPHIDMPLNSTTEQMEQVNDQAHDI